MFRVKSQYQGSHNTRTWQQDHHEASHLYGWHLEGKSRPHGTHSAAPGLLLQAPLHIYIPCSSSVTESISAQSAHLSSGSPLHVLRTSQTEQQIQSWDLSKCTTFCAQVSSQVEKLRSQNLVAAGLGLSDFFSLLILFWSFFLIATDVAESITRCLSCMMEK